MPDINKRPLRQLPPTAVPITNHDLLTGLRASTESYPQFIAALADYFAISKEAIVLASSGRTVLYYLLKGLQEANRARSQVIIPAYTCPALAKVTLDLGLQPVFVDIDPDSTQYAIDQLKESISEQTLAIMLVHPFGIPLPIEDIQAVAHEFGVTIIEDAAQAMGARRGEQPGQEEVSCHDHWRSA